MSTTSVPVAHPTTIPQALPWTSWAAVIAGTVTAIAVQIALTELCIGSGLSLYEPADPASSATTIAAGTAVAWLVCGLIAIFAGSWVTGRMKRHGTRVEAAIHGTLVWAVAGILTLLLTTVSLGVLTGGALALLGKGISGVAQGVGAAAPAVAQAAAPSWDAVKQQVEGAIGKLDGAANVPASDSRFADRSRLMQLLGQTFTIDGKPLSETDRQELTTLIASQLGIPAEAATKTLDQWQRVWREGAERFQAAKEDAKRTAIEAATVAKRRTAQAAFIAFLVMIAGLGAAIAGAVSGSTCVWTRARAEEEARGTVPVAYT